MTQINNYKLAAAFLLIAGLLTSGCSSSPVTGGVKDGNLTDCPSSPNCVSTEAEDEDHQFVPLTFSGSPEQAKKKLMEAINDYPDTNIVVVKDNYIHAEFTTSLMGFVDDCEFLVGDGNIQLRSASRVGYSDTGKNRSRMEEIKQAFEPCCE